MEYNSIIVTILFMIFVWSVIVGTIVVNKLCLIEYLLKEIIDELKTNKIK